MTPSHPKHTSSFQRSLLLVPALVLTILAFAAAPAFAEKIYYPGVSFGGPCVVKAGERCEGKFDEPAGVAVNDESGDVYVVDKGNKRVEEFTETGVFLAEFAPPGGFEDPEEIVVDNSGNPMTGQGDVYVTDTGHKVIDKFSATGAYEGQMTEAEICEYNKFGDEPICEVLPFGSLHGVAVDSAGDLWLSQEVVDRTNHEPYAFVDEFNDSGEFLRTFRTTGGTIDNAMGVDSDENVYLDETHEDNVAVYTPSEAQGDHGTEYVIGGGTAMAITPPSSSLLAGDPLVDSGGAISLYNPITKSNQQPLETFPGETVPKGYEGLSESDGLAVNVSATVYASEHAADRIESFDYVSVPVVKTEPALESGVSETGLTVHGTVNPEGEPIKECYFEYGTEASKYTNSKGETNRIACGSNEKSPGEGCGQNPSGKNEAVAVCAVLTGLQPAQVRSFRLVVEAGSGIVKYGAGLTVTRPEISGEAISDVGSTAATLSAEVDPAGYETCYRIEYGATTAYGGNAEGECIGAGDEAVAITREVSGLESNVVYHFRVVASNALGAKMGEDVVAVTFPAGEGELPDGRVYELVSASPLAEDSDDGNVYVPSPALLKVGGEALDPFNGTSPHGIASELPAQVAESGEAVTYAGDPPASGGGGREGNQAGNQYVARRAAGGGWTQVSLSPPGVENAYLAFPGDLSTGVLETGGSEQFASDAPEGYPELYSRSTAGGPFEPLFTAAPENRTPKEFGFVEGDDQLERTHPLTLAGGNAGTGAVPAFSHLVFEASAVLPSTPPAPEGGTGANNLYDSVGGRLYLVNVLPNGEAQAGATLGIEEGRDESGTNGRDSSNAVSADGSRIYWSTPEWVLGGRGYEERASALYVRENDTQSQSPVEEGRCTVPTDACTVQVDLKEPGSSGQNGGGQFVGASSDGSRVFFTDENRLTGDSLAEAGKPDLYEYDLEAPEEERLTDLSAPPQPGAGANVQGVVGISEDGSYVYFVADGVLREGANAEGAEPVEGRPNLYVHHDAHNTFIATLGPSDGNFTITTEEIPALGDWQRDPGHRTAEVSPDGRAVTFMSTLPLTHYDNVFKGVPVTEVFVYEAETGRIACASCNPSGEPPVTSGGRAHGEPPEALDWGSFLAPSGSLDAYQPRVISEGGSRVFFDSMEPLVPRDSNDRLDVYEWERDGAGSCTLPQGCVYLLSGGQNPENSYFLDASVSGDDVFFVSRAQLTSEDRGSETFELYDARVGGVTTHPEASCSGTGCQGVPPAPPIFATPASATIAGVEADEPPPPPAPEVKRVTKKTVKCKRGKKLTHGRCVKRSKSKKAKRAKSANRDRRANS